MKKIIFTILLISCCLNIYSQGRDNLWLLGNSPYPNQKMTIDFSTGTPVISNSNRSVKLWRNSANITDLNGNLLFYTNGAVVANAMDNVMPNGDSLSPSFYGLCGAWMYFGFPIPQASLILPNPGDSTKYYLIHSAMDILPTSVVTPLHLFYSEIDMKADSGRGDVISKNNILISDTLIDGNLTACKHANGTDWWLLMPEYNTGAFYIYLISANGIQYIDKQFIGQNLRCSGQTVFNPQGNKYAKFDSTNGLDVFDFNRVDGHLSNYKHVAFNDSSLGIGLAFSPDGSKLYTSSSLYIHQFDLYAPDLALSKTLVATWDSTYSPYETYFTLAQLAPDGKIYISTYFQTDILHVIDAPDNLGMACNVIQHGVQLPYINDGTVPNHPNYHLAPLITSTPVGLSENNIQSANLHLNPNPASKQVWVNYNFPNNKDGWLEIYDTMGKLLLKRRLYWSTTQLLVYLNEIKSNGVFVAKVYDDSGMFVSVEKLVVR